MPDITDQRTIQTTWGTICVEVRRGAVARCTLPFLNDDPKILFAVTQSGNDRISSFVAAALDGRTKKIPALDLSGGTEFQQMVWAGIAATPTGQHLTYRKLAEQIGRPAAVRAVANACGKNPVPLFIPCHRITRSDGGLGGFSAGLAWKRLLLSAEQ